MRLPALLALALLNAACADGLLGGDPDAAETGPDAADAGDGGGPDATSDADPGDAADAGADILDVAVDADSGLDLSTDLAQDLAVEDAVDAADAGPDADAAPDASSDAEPGPTRYVAGEIHSLLTPAVAERLVEIAAEGEGLRDDVFMKVGDSITVANPFLHCLADPDVDLEGRDELDETRDFFAAAADLEPPGGGTATTPFNRESLSAEGGRTAAWAVTPSDGPAPLVAERDAIDPRFAVVMYGTNDIGWWPEDFPRMFRWYGESMLQLVDELVESGVVPILSSIPPRLNSPDVLDPRVPSLNALVWGLAQSYQVPFVDYHLALATYTTDGGLSADGVHPRMACDDGVRCGCRFDETGLLAGYNVRNWVTLEALDRTRRVLIDGAPAPDEPVRPPLEGSGTPSDPYIIDALPFADFRDTGASPADAIDGYPGCSAGQDESGPEVYYALSLDASTPVAALVVDRPGDDIDLHILEGSTDPDDCRVRNDTFIEDTLPAGEWVLVLDTWVNAGGTALPGEYLFVVHER